MVSCELLHPARDSDRYRLSEVDRPLSRPIRFEPDPIIDSVVEALLASEISLGCLHRDMSQQELNLLQLPTCLMTKTGTSSTEVMGRQSWNLTDSCFLFHYTPYGLRAETATPDSTSFVD